MFLFVTNVFHVIFLSTVIGSISCKREMLEGVNEPRLDGPHLSTSSTRTSKTNRQKQMEADMACSSLPQDHRIMTLKRQHTEHLLEVIHTADKQENERQKKLGRATSKADILYLKTRFKVERRKTRRHITNLLKDAEILQAATAPSKHNSHPDSAMTNARRSSRASQGGKNGTVREGKAFNAFLEPKLGGDPAFIDNEKMRFLQYMNKHFDNQKIPVRRKGVWAKASSVPGNDFDKRHRPRLSGETTRLNRKTDCPLNIPSAAARTPRNALDKKPCSRSAEELDRGRIRLLQQKREILQDLKGVISRQTEALDRLAKGDTADKQIGSGTRENQTIRDGFSRTQDKRASSGGTRLQREESGTSGRNTSKVSGFTPKLPSDNATSTFLALGGRWGDHEGGESSLPGSVATSVSFATYCERRQKESVKCGRVGRRPRVVPPLPIKGR